MYLVIDNYDSFTYNLVHYLEMLGLDVLVVRNDAISVDEITSMAPEAILISPGPGRPEDAGISIEVVRRLGKHFPILGVCLGHQAIAVAYGGRVVRGTPVHGKTSPIRHSYQGVFLNLPSPFTAARYHSLVVEEESLPEGLQITAKTSGGEIMGLQHTHDPVIGIQFHPESIASEHGLKMLENFATLAARYHGQEFERAGEAVR
ncbi:MAG: aminodeoxychorismate/anthranilate synthase component II [Sphingomonadales bacterium]